MIEELKDEQLVNKVGGRFKLSALIQKRLVALNKGSRASIDEGESGRSAKDKLEVVIKEIMQDKVYLDMQEKHHGFHDLGAVEMVLDTEFTEGG